MYGGSGDDLLEGGLGNDTILEGSSSGFDTAVFENISLEGMSFSKKANDLICTFSQTGNQVDFSNWFFGNNYKIDKFQFSGGSLNAAQIDKKFA